MTDTPIQRLSKLRATIEAIGARYAASRIAADPQQVAALRTIVKRINTSLRKRDYAGFRKADYELHAAVMAAADVPFLRDVWQIVWSGLLDFHETGFEHSIPDSRILIGEHDHLIETIALGDPIAAEDAARCHVEAIWFRMTKHDSSALPRGSGTFYRAAAHIVSHLHCPVRLGEVAAQVAFTSPRNLSRLVHQHTGLSFRSYLQKLRMEKAAELLNTTRLPVSIIARRVGYPDASRFCQYFKRQFRTQPGQWRKQSAWPRTHNTGHNSSELMK